MHNCFRGQGVSWFLQMWKLSSSVKMRGEQQRSKIWLTLFFERSMMQYSSQRYKYLKTNCWVRLFYCILMGVTPVCVTPETWFHCLYFVLCKLFIPIGDVCLIDWTASSQSQSLDRHSRPEKSWQLKQVLACDNMSFTAVRLQTFNCWSSS